MNLFLVSLAVTLASVAHAEDVTLFAVPFSQASGSPPPFHSVSFLGASPVSVDEAGATNYVYSQVYSWTKSPVPSGIDEVFTLTRTLKADATRVLQEVTTTLPGDMGVQEDRYECVHHENGTSVCQNRLVFKEAGTTTTLIDVTVTSTSSPWVTIKGAESAVPTGDDEGGASPALGHSNLIGFIANTLGVAFALALI
ncbi:hypothetical protein BKA70DRAFT_1460397 [Coprinopsis sp. MPI-PUGE-AT-0042]|nr:hypothetical protein BKA70DRAFT_1460397 [Coprinopsis sp. MPI-PUGE-AT-0042]